MNIKITILVLGLILKGFNSNAQIWVSKESKLSFFSSTPIEDIKAESKKGCAALNIQTGKIIFLAKISSLIFTNPLMQEHFNENYMESEKYPFAEFIGIIQNKPDLAKNGTYLVYILGTFTLHGVKNERTIQATITVKDEYISGESKFEVACKDHNIEIPKIVIKNIAESIAVSLNINFIAK